MKDSHSIDLDALKDNPKYKRYVSSLNKFLKECLPRIPHTHVFLTGSFVTGSLHDGSDVDVDIIHPDTRQTIVKRINIDGVDVEYAPFSFDMIDKKLSGKIEYDHTELLAKAVTQWKMVKGDVFPVKLVAKARRYLKNMK